MQRLHPEKCLFLGGFQRGERLTGSQEVGDQE